MKDMYHMLLKRGKQRAPEIWQRLSEIPLRSHWSTGRCTWSYTARWPGVFRLFSAYCLAVHGGFGHSQPQIMRHRRCTCCLQTAVCESQIGQSASLVFGFQGLSWCFFRRCYNQRVWCLWPSPMFLSSHFCEYGSPGADIILISKLHQDNCMHKCISLPNPAIISLQSPALLAVIQPTTHSALAAAPVSSPWCLGAPCVPFCSHICPGKFTQVCFEDLVWQENKAYYQNKK